MADHFGVAPGIQLIDPTRINIVAKAQFRRPVLCCESCYDFCVKTDRRKYMYALENGLEMNNPWMFCTCCEPSCCCPIYDNISKQHFDVGNLPCNGLWDKQDCYWGIGFFKGNGFFFANNRQYVCCCSDCGACCNGFMDGGYYLSMCGDRLRFQQAETCCFCFEMKAGCCTNYMGLIGLKNGEPTGINSAWCVPTAGSVCCLEEGTAEDFASKINAARTAWRTRTGLE